MYLNLNKGDLLLSCSSQKKQTRFRSHQRFGLHNRLSTCNCRKTIKSINNDSLQCFSVSMQAHNVRTIPQRKAVMVYTLYTCVFLHWGRSVACEWCPMYVLDRWMARCEKMSSSCSYRLLIWARGGINIQPLSFLNLHQACGQLSAHLSRGGKPLSGFVIKNEWNPSYFFNIMQLTVYLLVRGALNRSAKARICK